MTPLVWVRGSAPPSLSSTQACGQSWAAPQWEFLQGDPRKRREHLFPCSKRPSEYQMQKHVPLLNLKGIWLFVRQASAAGEARAEMSPSQDSITMLGARLLNTSGKKTNLTQPKTKVFKALGISLPWHYEWTRRRKILPRDKATIKELQRRLRQIGNDKSATCTPGCQALWLSLLIPKQNILLVTCFT